MGVPPPPYIKQELSIGFGFIEPNRRNKPKPVVTLHTIPDKNKNQGKDPKIKQYQKLRISS